VYKEEKKFEAEPKSITKEDHDTHTPIFYGTLKAE
jgi:hypothetical protein